MPHGSPSLGVNLSYDPFAASRSVVRRAVEPEQPAQIPNGFTTLPNGNLMYSVANDPLKLYAEAAAQADARLANPRINNLDSPDRLYQELFAPLDAMYGRNQQVNPPRIFESSSGIVAVDPNTLKTKQVATYNKPEALLDPIERLELSSMYTQLNKMLTSDAADRALNKPQIESLQSAIKQKTEQLRNKTQATSPAPQNSVAPKTPQVYFGDRVADPFANTPAPSMTGTSTNTVKTKSGNTYKIRSL